jgi:4-carboxymuconolactone decarboxylase
MRLFWEAESLRRSAALLRDMTGTVTAAGKVSSKGPPGARPDVLPKQRLPWLHAFSDRICTARIKEERMTEYYNDGDLDRFAEVGNYSPELFRKFMEWYTASLTEGALSKREKVLIGLAVAHVLQCPYCIDAYTKSCMEEGLNLDHITEAAHVASAVRGGASLIHTIQAHNAVERISL